MSGYRLAAVAVLGVLASSPAMAGEDKWGGHIDLEGKAGTNRNLGEADLFLPVAQDSTSLLFANLRTRMDDQSSREGNFGLGLRHMLESGWNLGGYGYFDRRRSEYHNYFNQMTLGAEALSLDWDFRVNGYVPVGRHSYDEGSLDTFEVSGTGIIFRGGEESSLGGFDAEIGWRVPVFAGDAGQQLRVYVGGYRFADEGIPMVAGPRGRAEMVFDEVPGLWDGSRLSVGAELQNDDPRGSQGFLSARLRIPLQAEAKASRLTPMERRMTDPIVRDIDVVAQAGAFGAVETATAGNGGTVMVINSSATTGANLQAALNSAGANSTVILSGTFDTDTAITLNSGQTLMGGGSVTVRSPSGRTATLMPSSGATISATTLALSAAVEMASNSTLTGLTIRQTAANTMPAYGVKVTGDSGATISNNTITVSSGLNGAIGVRIDSGSSNITVNNNTITAINSGGGVAFGLFMSALSATVANNSFTAFSTLSGNDFDVYRSGGTMTVSGNTYSGVGCHGIVCP